MIGKELTIDIKNKKDYPKVIYKEETEGHLMLQLEFKDGSTYNAIVEKITTNGKYFVKIVEKI
jgi:hypothetical protein